MRLGTKSIGDREDEEAERLVRPLPKKKPPRKDRRRERMDVERDPDLSDEDTKRDPDLSLNRKNIGGSVNLLRILRNARNADRVKVRRKEDGKVVDVSRDTLKERGGEYEVFKPSSKWEQEADDFSERLKSDPGLESRLRNLVDPKSDTGGLAEGNPDFPAGPFEKNLPPNVKTLGDLRDLAREVLSRPKTKPKKNKKEAPPGEEAPPSSAGPQKSESAPEKPPTQDSAEKGSPKGLPAVPPKVQQVISDLTKLLTKPEREKPDASKPNENPSDSGGTPVQKEEISEEPQAEAPKAPKPSKKAPAEEFPRRKPSQRETFEARQMVIDTFPPKLAAKFINLHPDDIHELVGNYHDLKAGEMKVEHVADEIAKVKDWSLDPASVRAPDKVDVGGKEVKLSELSPEAQSEAVQKHRMAVIGARLAVRSQAVKALKNTGAPSRLAGHVVDFMLASGSMDPEERLKKAQEKARDVFVDSSTEPDVDEEGSDPRFGTSAVRAVAQETPPKVRASVIGKIKDPVAKTLAIAAFQGEDYRTALKVYLGSDSPDRISEKDSPSKIMAKISDAQRFFEKKSKGYPKDIVEGLEDPSTVFRVRVRHAISNMNPEKSRALVEPFAKLEADMYDRSMKAYEKAAERHKKLVAEWEKTQKGKLPVAPVPPRRPPQYGLVRPPPSEGEARERRDKLLVAKQASYSSYPSDRWQTPGLDGSNHRETRRVSKHAEGAMTAIKFAKEDANRILSRLDKMAGAIQANYEQWGMPFEVAKGLVQGLDRTADEIESATFGPQSLANRQISVLKEAKVIQQDSDEGYMATFNAPMAPHQADSDEPYMGQFKDDQSQAVATGKSTTGRPLAP